MPERHDPSPPTEWERDQARESVTQRLALISATVWAVGMVAFMLFFFPSGNFKPSSGMVVGVWLLALASLPWVVYSRLVDREVYARRRRGENQQ
jgi:hypothetical protein